MLKILQNLDKQKTAMATPEPPLKTVEAVIYRELALRPSLTFNLLDAVQAAGFRMEYQALLWHLSQMERQGIVIGEWTGPPNCPTRIWRSRQ